jgi:hypothetical protein
MATIGDSLQKLITNASKTLGEFQVGVNKILWGSGNIQPKQTVRYDAKAGEYKYTTTPTVAVPPKTGSLIESGLFNALDAINRVDICNILTYAYDNVNSRAPKKSDRAQSPTSQQKALYKLQDSCADIVSYIDKYTAYPNVIIGSYATVGPDPQSLEATATTQEVPSESLSGTTIQKYNLYNLILIIKDSFAVGNSSTGTILTKEDEVLITQVPTLGANINIIDNFIRSTNRYTDYSQITNEDVTKIRASINTLRAVCVTVQNLDFKRAIVIAGNFLNIDVRSELQELSKFMDPLKLIPTLKQINSAIQSFIRIAQKVQNVINLGQFLIKLTLLLIKVFRFLLYYFGILPIPMLYFTYGAQSKISDIKDAAKDNVSGLARVLNGLNALLSITTIFVRYLLTNAVELQRRLQILLLNLEVCESMKGSDILDELRRTSEALKILETQLGDYIRMYDSKTDPETAVFGEYDIRVVDEEVTDPDIPNKRRRGIALDQNGFIVVQSDLTFATNATIIINEVKLKLMAAGLVQPSYGALDGANLIIIGESLTYLDNNDVLQDDLNIQTFENADTPDNLDESQGLGLNAFLNNLPGGRRLRKRVRTSLDSASIQVASQLAAEKQAASSALRPK